MLNYFLYSIALALFVAWCLNVFTISGAREDCIMKAPYEWLAKLLSCDFCLSFWSCLALTLMFCWISQYVILTPLMASVVKKLI